MRIFFSCLCALLLAPLVSSAAESVWPTYQYDHGRSGASPAALPLPLHLQWSHELRHPPVPAWPPPAKQNFWAGQFDLPARVIYDRANHLISDGNRVYCGSSADDQVRCFDLQSGKELWTFFTEGPVRFAPVLADEKIFFGSDDGCVYALASQSGQLLWNWEGLPGDPRIPGNSRIIAAHPIRTSLIVHAGHVRFGCGLFPLQGTYQFALDAATGRETALSKLNFSPQGYLVSQGNSIAVPQGRAPAATLAATEKGEAAASTNFQNLPAEYNLARIAAGETRFAGGEGKVAAFDAAGKPIWTAEVKGNAYGLAVAGGCLLVSTDQGVLYCFSAAEQKPAEIKPPQAFEEIDEAAEITWAREIVAENNSIPGYCLVVGSDNGRLCREIARQSKLQVVGLETNPKQAEASRRATAAAGLYGHVSIHRGDFEKLRYGDWLFNLVVVNLSHESVNKMSPGEIARVVAPGGWIVLAGSEEELSAAADWFASAEELQRIDPAGAMPVWRKKRPSGAGQWTHLYGDAGNSACSGDEHVGGSLALQWFGPPGPRDLVDRHHRSMSPLFAAGRLFVAGNDKLYGVDAYNGAVLWEAEVPGFRRVGIMRDCGSMAAADDALYVVAGGKLQQRDPNSGRQQREYLPPLEKDAPPLDWGYIAVEGNTLIGSATVKGAARGEHSKKQIDDTYYDARPVVISRRIFAFDRRSGELLWQYEPRGAVANSTLALAAGQVCFIESSKEETLREPTGRVALPKLVADGADVVALDLKSGETKWKVSLSLNQAEHSLYLASAAGKLVATASRNQGNNVWYDMAAFEAATGKSLWTASHNSRKGTGGSHGEQDLHPAIVKETLYMEPFAYDLASGKKREGWDFRRGGHGCGTVSASASAIFYRAGNPTMCNLETGQAAPVNRVSRPGCWINMLPVGGLLLIPEASSGCTCNFPIQASLAFRPVKSEP